MELMKNIANLIKVKTIVTVRVVLVFGVLAFAGRITSDNVMVIVSMVISFYFGTQHERPASAGKQFVTDTNQ